MNHELAKTLTTALVQFIDRERPEGTMCCSNTDCENIRGAFEEGEYEVVESFIRHKLTRLTEFEEELVVFYNKRNMILPDKDGVYNKHDCEELLHESAKTLLALAKKELLSYPDESNPKIEAMADLERTYFCNPDKLPKWLKDDIARKELDAHTKGYNKGYNDAEKRYNESVAYHFPIMPTPPSGWGCDGTHCTNPHGDCINCPKRFTTGGTITTPNSAVSVGSSGGNTSVTDGKEHNPSFID